MTEKFLLKRLECRCRVCKTEFSFDYSIDNEIVKMHFDNESNARWIKMYGERGYLSLIEKLVEKGASKQISMKTVSILEEKISDCLNKRVIFDKGIRRCPTCNSKDISVINEIFLESDELDLFEIEI